MRKIPGGTEHIDKWKINLRTLPEVHLHAHPELESRIRNIHILALARLMAFLSALMNLLVLFIGQQQRKQIKNQTYLCIGASSKDMLLKGWIELFVPMAIAYLFGVLPDRSNLPLLRKLYGMESLRHL